MLDWLLFHEFVVKLNREYLNPQKILILVTAHNFLPDKQDAEDFLVRVRESTLTYSNGDIRLVSDSDSSCLSPSSGRLEVHMNTLLKDEGDEDEDDEDEGSGGTTTGAWGSVCGVGFTLTEANVACRQLGFAAAWKFELSSETG